MQVYIELALFENFCMDFSLLYCAKLITKNTNSLKCIALASVFGACFAVIFPLISINQVVDFILKIMSGLIICGVGGKFSNIKGFIKFTFSFFALTFLLGGALIAIFSFFNIEYEQGAGYLISSIPIGIPLFFVVMLAIVCKYFTSKFVSNNSKIAVSCHIVRGQLSIDVGGFYDSGNKVFYKGAPVSIIDLSLAKKIIDVSCITSVVKIHTVAGSQNIKVFTVDEVLLYTDEKSHKIKNVTFGISPTPISSVVLHPDLSEVN